MQKNELYDAIVIGSGISGGWAAKELCENGLKTLVLERGRMVEHIKDYPTMNMDPWDFENRGEVSPQQAKRQEKQARSGYVHKAVSNHWFVDDIDHPYDEIKRFDWIRGYHVGGRSIMWGRQALRFSDLDFEANKKDGHGVDWPIRYKDLAKWYSKCEEFIGVAAEKMDLPQLPDGEFTPPIPLNCVEQDFRDKIEKHYSNRHLFMGRFANLTGDKKHEGRSNCQFRNRCIRGCPFGGYFSSLSSTLPAAERTGNMVLRPNSIVRKISFDDTTNKATGVEVIDRLTKEVTFYKAKVIFCCASTVGSTAILMNSISNRFPNGLGNDSGELGHNLMDHPFRAGATAEVEGFDGKYYKGRTPASFHIPRFKNLGDKESEDTSFLRGYAFQGGASRENWQRGIAEMTYGNKLKETLLKPGPWKIGVGGFGECLPYHENRMYLNFDKLNDWGEPRVIFDAEYKENEKAMIADMQIEAEKMLKMAGYKNVEKYENPVYVGTTIHEMGTARMGRDPKTSVLGKYNQIHAVPNVFVTDGACMTSSAYQNPSLTYMAISARAANYAAGQVKQNKF
ncbi:GMC family oxidoreductase [Urechidicola vernalis]|uniref:GMC family oxidoreductase n=1 Tax=Urechidicola vernalis TaxID=3075600 RepID=A0ABU2Y590_9FLAO|nr:GMC family oxidoreductase [Urechidicola sp. P050]MDT0552824.1 GMC family oxidoreductase [Urechidicola sp. P050]